jgi:hypothetical protein
VYTEGGEVVGEDGRGATYRAALAGARAVRVVPLSGGSPHAVGPAGGWQVALAYAGGDGVLGTPLADWRAARELARLVCEKTELPLDELTQAMFSRVGSFSPQPPQPPKSAEEV